MRLSVTQIEQFQENGFLIVENALDDADIDPVIAEYEVHIDRRARELLAAGKITELHEGALFDRRLALICEQSMDIYPELDIYQLRAKAAFEFLSNRNLLDIVEGIVGPEITCNPAQHLRAKLPSRLMSGPLGHVASWHHGIRTWVLSSVNRTHISFSRCGCR
jgi:phytanoyl-CoA hydroxylase